MLLLTFQIGSGWVAIACRFWWHVASHSRRTQIARTFIWSKKTTFCFSFTWDFISNSPKKNPKNCFNEQARVYAENPRANFLPHTGHLAHLRPPTESANVRVDTGVREGDDVSVYYDPMIAKLIVWENDRATALRRLDAALADYQIAGK